jgi:hypothetical protein
MQYSTANLRIHRFTSLQPGPRLIVTGAVHGSETSGTRGIEKVLARTRQRRALHRARQPDPTATGTESAGLQQRQSAMVTAT